MGNNGAGHGPSQRNAGLFDGKDHGHHAGGGGADQQVGAGRGRRSVTDPHDQDAEHHPGDRCTGNRGQPQSAAVQADLTVARRPDLGHFPPAR